jgi:hypothetical protein
MLKMQHQQLLISDQISNLIGIPQQSTSREYFIGIIRILVSSGDLIQITYLTNRRSA